MKKFSIFFIVLFLFFFGCAKKTVYSDKEKIRKKLFIESVVTGSVGLIADPTNLVFHGLNALNILLSSGKPTPSESEKKEIKAEPPSEETKAKSLLIETNQLQ